MHQEEECTRITCSCEGSSQEMDLGITENEGQGNSSQSTELWRWQGLSLRHRVRALQFRPKGISALVWTKGCWSFLTENIYYSYFISLKTF